MGKKAGETPGLKILNQRGRLEARWVARPDIVAMGYTPRTVRLSPEPYVGMTDIEKTAAYSFHCARLWSEMIEFAAGIVVPIEKKFDGTMLSLSRIFQMHNDSQFHRVTMASRKNYIYYCKEIERTVGQVKIEYLTGVDFRRWHKNFAEPAKIGNPKTLRNAQAIMNMIRGMLRFGTELRLAGVKDTHAILSQLKFEAPKKRTIFMQYHQAEAIINMALDLWRENKDRTALSIALGQAFQFETTLRQTDVIGIWEGKDWKDGITWERIESGILHGFTRKTGKEYYFQLDQYPLIVRARAAVPEEFKKGAVVVSSKFNQPFRDSSYTSSWRKVATMAGVPLNIMNRDSRSGGVTEATDAGAPLENVRHMAQHSNVQTTAGYSRNSAIKTAEVAHIRSASRGVK